MVCIGFCGGLGRCCLILINVIFIILFVVVLLLFTAVWVYPDIPLILDGYEGNTKDIMYNVTEVTGMDDWHITSFSLFGAFLYLVWGVTGVGLLLSVCGCAASCCKQKGCMCAYSIIVLILLLVQIVIFLLLSRESNPFYQTFVNTMDTSFKKYKGIGGGTDDDNGWTFIMWNYMCCGVKGYKVSETFLQSLSSTKSCCAEDAVMKGTCTKADMFQVGCATTLYDLTAGENGYVLYCPYIIIIQVLLILFGCCTTVKLQLNNQVSDELEERIPPKEKLSEKSPKERDLPNAFIY